MITDQKTIDGLKELNYSQVYEKGKQDAKTEILEKIDGDWIANRIIAEHRKYKKFKDNLWVFSAQAKIKGALKQQLTELKDGDTK